MATTPPWTRGLRLAAVMALVAATAVFNVSVRPAWADPGITGSVGSPSATNFGKIVIFTGSVTNTGTVNGTEDFTSVGIADNGSVGLTITSITPVGALPAAPPPGPPPPPSTTASFTVTAQILGLPGTSAQLKLLATGVTAGPTADPTIAIDSASFTVTEAVALTVETQRRGPADAGFTTCGPPCSVSTEDALRYRVTIQNSSDLLAAVNITSAGVPANTTDAGTSTIPAVPVALSAGESQTFNRDVTVNDPTSDATPPQPGTVLTFAPTATYTTAAPAPVVINRPAAGSGTAYTATVADPKIDITNTIVDNNGGQLVRNDPVGSTITIDNTGTANATNAVLTINLVNLENPEGIKLNNVELAGNDNRVTTSANQLIIRLGTGANNSSGGTIQPADPLITVEFISFVPANPSGSSATSTASLSFDNGGVSPKEAVATKTILGQPSVTLSITPNPASNVAVARGSDITYTVTATNAAGVANATNLVISFPVPAGTTFVSASSSAGGPAPTGGTVGSPGGTITKNFGSLAADGVTTATLTVTVKVANTTVPVANGDPSAAPNDIVAGASATFGPGINPTVNAPTVGHELQIAQLTLTSTMTDVTPIADPGQLLRGETVDTAIAVHNEGNATALGAVLNVTLTNLGTPTLITIGGFPTASSYNPSTKILTIALGDIAAGGTVNVAFQADVVNNPSGSPPKASALPSVSYGNGTASGQTTVNGTVAEIVIVENPSVSLLITATPAAPGPVPVSTPTVPSQISYAVKASNLPGKGNAKDVVVSFPVPANTTFVSASGGTLGALPADGSAGGTVTTTFATINPGDDATLTVVVKVVEAAAAVKFPGDNAAINDDTPANDIVTNASATYGPGANPPAPVTQVAHEISSADLTLSISPVTLEIQKNKPADVTATIANLGPNAATGTKTVVFTLTGSGAFLSQGLPTGCNLDSTVQVTCTSSTAIAKNGTKAFTVKVQSANVDAVTVTATLSTTGVEIDEDGTNDDPKQAVITFLQSKSDLTVVGTPEELELDVCPQPEVLGQCGPAEQVTFTLTAVDPGEPGPGNSTKNDNDDVEAAVALLTVPLGLTATITPEQGTCDAPVVGLTATTVSCTIGSITVANPIDIAVSLQGTVLLTDAQVTIQVTAANIDPSIPAVPTSPGVPGTRSDTVTVDVVTQKVDLSITSDLGTVELTTDDPTDLTVTRDFDVTVTNASAYTAASYTVTITATGPGSLTVTPDADCTPSGGGSVLTCTGSLAKTGAGDTKVYAVTVTLSEPGPTSVTATVEETGPTTPEDTQVDPDLTNNDALPGSLTRNLPPTVLADVGPTIPMGSVLLFSVLDNDTDGDDADIPNLTVLKSSPAGATSGVTVDTVPGPQCAGLADVARQCFKVDASAATAPVDNLVVTYEVRDGRPLPSTPSQTTFTVDVVPAPAPTVEGSFGDTPTNAPTSFGLPATLDTAVTTPIDLLDGALGQDANASPLPATAAPGVISYDLRTVGGTRVTGAAADVGAGTNRSVAEYTPARGYTTDQAVGGTPAAAPPDTIAYTATGKNGDNTIFSVTNTVLVRVTNQRPIGVDLELVIVPNTGPSNKDPLVNDVDGNTVSTPIDVSGVSGGPFTFDDKNSLQILCIGPYPTPAQLAAGPVDEPCTNEPGMVLPGADLTVRALDDSGAITARVATATSTEAGTVANRTVTITPDSSVADRVPFAAVIVDSFGGTAFSPIDVVVTNQPPEVIAGVPAVPKNSPPTEVIDTVDAGRDNNGDLVVISGFTQPEHGTVFVKDQTILMYEPERDYVGPDSLILEVSDSRGTGSNQAQLNIDVVETASQPTATDAGSGTGTGTGGAPAGPLPATGGDPLALTVGGAASLLVGFLLLQASKRRQSLPLLAGARHLRT